MFIGNQVHKLPTTVEKVQRARCCAKDNIVVGDIKARILEIDVCELGRFSYCITINFYLDPIAVPQRLRQMW